jgi:hypothetical protein
MKMTDEERENILMVTGNNIYHDNRYYTNDTKVYGNFKWKQYNEKMVENNQYSLSWRTNEGDPKITVSIDQEIDFISDSSDSEYEYKLYI